MRGIELPIMEETGYYEIRLESIGGLGANLCGKLLGELGVNYLGLNSMSFSSYGSEKTGTPVKAFIRYCQGEKEIRDHSPVVKPNLLAIFHQALLQEETVFAGCGGYTQVVLGLDEVSREAEGFFPEEVTDCFGIPAQEIARETHSRVNMVMLGAIARVMGFVQQEEIRKLCMNTLGKKYPEALSGNLEGLRRGYEEVQKIEIKRKKPSSCGCREPEWGYLTAPQGGINPRFGSTVTVDLSPSRQGYIPLFIKERCINCGLCDSTCPDMVFQFAKGMYQGRKMMVNQGLDYYHCKGCLRCVDVCPVNALVRGLEIQHPKKDFMMPNQDLLRNQEDYCKAGPDGYITSESYLTEQRMEGGEV